MITRELLKTEIDKVQDEDLEIFYKVIKAFEPSIKTDVFDQTEKDMVENDTELSWRDFIKETYGCLAGVPIERGSQGEYEIREVIE